MSDARSPWFYGLVWALPFSLWLAVLLGTVASVPLAWSRWRSTHEAYQYQLDHPEFGSEDAARTQAEVDREAMVGLAARGVVVALCAAAPMVYRRRVPRERRGGLRGWAIAGVLTLGLGVVGFWLVAAALAGSIRG